MDEIDNLKVNNLTFGDEETWYDKINSTDDTDTNIVEEVQSTKTEETENSTETDNLFTIEDFKTFNLFTDDFKGSLLDFLKDDVFKKEYKELLEYTFTDFKPFENIGLTNNKEKEKEEDKEEDKGEEKPNSLIDEIQNLINPKTDDTFTLTDKGVDLLNSTENRELTNSYVQEIKASDVKNLKEDTTDNIENFELINLVNSGLEIISDLKNTPLTLMKGENNEFIPPSSIPQYQTANSLIEEINTYDEKDDPTIQQTLNLLSSYVELFDNTYDNFKSSLSKRDTKKLETIETNNNEQNINIGSSVVESLKNVNENPKEDLQEKEETEENSPKETLNIIKDLLTEFLTSYQAKIQKDDEKQEQQNPQNKDEDKKQNEDEKQQNEDEDEKDEDEEYKDISKNDDVIDVIKEVLNENKKEEDDAPSPLKVATDVIAIGSKVATLL